MAIGGELQRRWRVRQLAGDKRAGSYARGVARRKQRLFVRDTWKVFAVFALMVCAIGAFVAWLMPSELLRGVVIGFTLCGVPAFLWSFTVQLTGTAPVMMGDQAEQWTAQELRKLAKRGWLLINHLPLDGRDVDHLLIGPGGVVLVETKWCAAWDDAYGQSRQVDAARQAERTAATLGRWVELKRRHLPVRPVVVLWGGGTSQWTDSQLVREVAGVPVVAGRSLVSFIEGLDSVGMVPGAAEDTWEALDRHVRARDPHDLAANPIPLSLTDLVVMTLVFTVALALGFGALVLVVTLTQSTLAFFASMALLVAMGVPAYRWRPARLAAIGWLVSVVGSAVYVMVAVWLAL